MVFVNPSWQVLAYTCKYLGAPHIPPPRRHVLLYGDQQGMSGLSAHDCLYTLRDDRPEIEVQGATGEGRAATRAEGAHAPGNTDHRPRHHAGDVPGRARPDD